MKRLSNNLVVVLYLGSSIVALVIALFTFVMMDSLIDMIKNNTQERMIASAEAASLLVTADELDEFMSIDDMAKQSYADLRFKLNEFSIENSLTYTYYMRLITVPSEDGEQRMMQYIIDNVIDPNDTPDGLDSEPVAREATPDKALAGTPACTAIGSYSDGWDGYISGFAPVFYADGSISEIVAGVDIIDRDILNARNSVIILVVVFVVSFLTMLTGGLISTNLYRKKVKQAQSASEAKSSFLSRMSHEMRTPLNGISGLCRMALKAEGIDEIKGHLTNIMASSQYLKQLVDDVLDLSKIEAGKMKLEFVSSDLRAELENVKSIVMPQALAKDQEFSMTIDPQLPKCIDCDATRLRQILINLLSNAVKFTGNGGKISLEAAFGGCKDDRYKIIFAVRDTGIGMNKDLVASLFTPFEQGDVSITRRYGGTGLGLSISKQLVNLMDGEMSVESAENEGSVFTFYIYARQADDKAETLIDEDRKLDLSGKTVLLVDDSEINRIVAEDVLKGFGAVCVMAENGQEAVDIFTKSPAQFSFILMDVQMPLMDGYTATRLIRSSGKANAASIPIIAMTANVYREDVENALKSGMNAHIGKPFEVAQFAAVLRSCG